MYSHLIESGRIFDATNCAEVTAARLWHSLFYNNALVVFQVLD